MWCSSGPQSISDDGRSEWSLPGLYPSLRTSQNIYSWATVCFFLWTRAFPGWATDFLLRENLHPLAWTKRPVPLLPSLIPLASPGQDSQGDPRHVAINLLPSRTSVPRTYVSARQKGLTEIHISYPDASAHVTYIWHWVYAGKVTAHPLGYKLYVGNSCLNSYLGHAAPRESTQQVFVDWMNKLKRRF